MLPLDHCNTAGRSKWLKPTGLFQRSVATCHCSALNWVNSCNGCATKKALLTPSCLLLAYNESTHRHMEDIHSVVQHKDTTCHGFAFSTRWRQRRSWCGAHDVWRISVSLEFTALRPFHWHHTRCWHLTDICYAHSCWAIHITRR